MDTALLDTLITQVPLDVPRASDWLHAEAGASGAVVMFSGLVRGEQGEVDTLTLEHYAGMSDRVLAQLAADVASRWPLQRVLAWHRVGSMSVGEVIVLVGVTAAHRQEAFLAASCLMDLLKTQVPLWKKVNGPQGEQWVEARDKDLQAAQRWR
ncbi:MAG: molybdenum cofactor biosynthesis protein MoaE [Alcanivoracaceae bacterium]|jgi:molybdopterin synthase catalytic subunit|nr:molybdenum cofactor biosynthesis protein MoaE [Alcanivoracaceae bacterium]